METQPSIEVPAKELSEEVLERLIEEFVLREGTDYGHRDWELSEKVAMVKKQMGRGEVKIFFDAETESCTLVKI